MTNDTPKPGLTEEMLAEVRSGLDADPQTQAGFDKWLKAYRARLAEGVEPARVLQRPVSPEVRSAVVEYLRHQVLLGLAEWRLRLAKMKIEAAGDAVRNAIEEFEPGVHALKAWSFDPQFFLLLERKDEGKEPAELASRLFTAARRLLALTLPELRSLRLEGAPAAMLENLPGGSEQFLVDLAEVAIAVGPDKVRAHVDEIGTVPAVAARVKEDDAAAKPLRFLAELAANARAGKD